MVKTTKTTKTVKKTAVKAVKTAPKVVKPAKVAVKPAKASFLDVPFYDVTGKEIKTLSLPKTVFGVEVKPALIAQYVRVHQNNQRQGNASSKTRAEIHGSTKKIFRQKGTGRARHGSKKSPTFVGGGVAFGPQPRDPSLKINQKQRRKAFLGALSLKVKDNSVAVLSNSALKMEPKTKLMAGFFKTAGYGKDKVLLVFPKMEKNNLTLATRNLPNVSMSSFDNLNAYEVLKYKKLLIVEDAVAKLESFVTKKS